MYWKRKEELIAAFMETPATEVGVNEREGMRAHQEGGRTSPEEASRAARTPKPMLQKFMDMFESCSTAGVAQGDMGYTIGWFIVWKYS